MKPTIARAASFSCLILTTLFTGLSSAAEMSMPPPGSRSLFDRLVAKQQADGRYAPEVPFPLESLLRTLAQKARGNAGVEVALPTNVLIPNGRSLQRDHTDVSNPRAVIGFTQHPPANSDVSLTLRDRVYIGYAAKANQLEVLSYNEEAGRFEFQIVADYREGGRREVLYADRAFCTKCHQQAAPLFSQNPWDETNANHGVAAALLAGANGAKTLFGFAATIGNRGSAYALDTSVQRANKLLAINNFWNKGCQDVSGVAGLPAQFKPEDCRAHVMLFALAATAGLPIAELSKAEGAYQFASYEAITAIWQKNLGGTASDFFVGSLENRNPSGFRDNQLIENPAPVALWTRNLNDKSPIDAALDPKTKRPEPFSYVDGIDHAKQALDMTIAQLSGMLTPSERDVLPGELNDFKAKIQGHFSDLLASGAFSGQPLRKGQVMAKLVSLLGVRSIGGQVPSAEFFVDAGKFVPAKVDEGVGSDTKGAAIVSEYCGTSCHAVIGFSGDKDFLAREGLTDHELWIKVIRRVGVKPCVRLNWNQMPAARRMPPRGVQFDMMLESETSNEPIRKYILDVYRDKLLEFAADDAAQQAVGMNAEQLKANAQQCEWKKFTGP